MSLRDGVSMSACGCLGRMYGEPHCICVMERLGLPLNETARAAERASAQTQFAELFAPGGFFHQLKREQ